MRSSRPGFVRTLRPTSRDAWSFLPGGKHAMTGLLEMRVHREHLVQPLRGDELEPHAVDEAQAAAVLTQQAFKAPAM